MTLSVNDLKYVVKQFVEGKPYTYGFDGEFDKDGFLGWDSGHGLYINGPQWYCVDSETKYGAFMPWDVDNHGSLMFNVGNGPWIHSEIIRAAGLYNYSSGARRSSRTTSDVAATPLYDIKFELLEVHDADNDKDIASQADFSANVRLGASSTTYHGPEDTRTTSFPATNLNNFASPVIPIRVDVLERDMPWDPDDQCNIASNSYRTSLFLYFDTRTGRITADATGAAGENIQVKTLSSLYNNVWVKIRVTRTQ